jgi:hypothetical protein
LGLSEEGEGNRDQKGQTKHKPHAGYLIGHVVSPQTN